MLDIELFIQHSTFNILNSLPSCGSEEVGGAAAEFSEEEGEAEDVAEGLGEGVEGVGESADEVASDDDDIAVLEGDILGGVAHERAFSVEFKGDGFLLYGVVSDDRDFGEVGLVGVEGRFGEGIHKATPVGDADFS